MLIRKPSDLPSSLITPETQYLNRRRFLRGAAAGSLIVGGAALGVNRIAGLISPRTRALADSAKLQTVKSPLTTTGEQLTSLDDVTHYNNYYEFGTDKTDPAANAGAFRTRPWSVTIAGEAEKTGNFTIEDILKPHALEERVYRLRCVEAWSMVIPWLGFPMGELLKRFNPTSKAKYVEFTSVFDSKQMPGQREDLLPWPYVEGLRIDEAMHPLAFMVVGVYGRTLPNQNGAPLRTMAPWKYGFKNGKAIVRIRFTESQPRNTWNVANAHEYGFYGNVNPTVDHPRWSQATERRIGGSFFSGSRQKTLMFNGYADQVASLYQGMDLRKYY